MVGWGGHRKVGWAKDTTKTQESERKIEVVELDNLQQYSVEKGRTSPYNPKPWQGRRNGRLFWGDGLPDLKQKRNFRNWLFGKISISAKYQECCGWDTGQYQVFSLFCKQPADYKPYFASYYQRFSLWWSENDRRRDHLILQALVYHKSAACSLFFQLVRQMSLPSEALLAGNTFSRGRNQVYESDCSPFATILGYSNKGWPTEYLGLLLGDPRELKDSGRWFWKGAGRG